MGSVWMGSEELNFPLFYIFLAFCLPSFFFVFSYYEARHDCTNNSETIRLCNKCACNWKINSQTIKVCN